MRWQTKLLGIALALLLAAPLAAQGVVTPPPTVEPASGCPAVINLSWNVAGIPEVNRVLWELKRDSDFTVPNGDEPGRLASGTAAATAGSVSIDLRRWGPVLNGTRYYVRIVAKRLNVDVAQRSASVLYAPDETYSSFDLVHNGSGLVQVSWGTNGPLLTSCVTEVELEVKQGGQFTSSTASEPSALLRETFQGASGSTTVDLNPSGPGTYYVRVSGRAKVFLSSCDVGRRGPGQAVTITTAAPSPTPTSISTPTPTPTRTPTRTPTQPAATPTVTPSTSPTVTPTQPALTPTATITPTRTPSLTPTGTVFTPTPTSTPTPFPPTPTSTPSYTPTVPPAAQIAPADARFNNPLTLPLDSTASVLDFVSYPGGDTEDRVRWDISGMNPNVALSGGRARLVIAMSCFGTGTQHIRAVTGGQIFQCGQTLVDREVTYDSRTGSVTIIAQGGGGTYVQWVLTGTAVRVN